MKELRSVMLRYGLAVAAPAVATGARWMLDPTLGEQAPYLLYLVAVAVVGVYGGLVPAVLALLLSAGAATTLFIPGAISVGPSEAVSALLFMLAGAVIILLTETLRVSQRGLRLATQDAEERADLLRRITDSVPVLLSYLDRDLCYRYASPLHDQWFPHLAVRGRPVREVLGEEAYAVVGPLLRRALAG